MIVSPYICLCRLYCVYIDGRIYDISVYIVYIRMGGYDISVYIVYIRMGGYDISVYLCSVGSLSRTPGKFMNKNMKEIKNPLVANINRSTGEIEISLAKNVSGSSHLCTCLTVWVQQKT